MFGYDSARDKYGFTIDGLFVPFRKGAIYLGEYSADTTIDVSELGAESADEFLAVATPQNMGGTNTGGIGYSTGIADCSCSYTAPSMSLSEDKTTLTLNVGSLYITGGMTGGSRLAWSDTRNNTVKVYYVGDIETAE